MKKVKLGIIGLGDMGTKYYKLILENNLEFDVVAITRIKEERLNKIKDLITKMPLIYNSDSDLFKAYDDNKINLDAILIVTCHYEHARIAKEALKRNLYVLVDKPISVTLEEGVSLLEYDENKIGCIFQQRAYESHKIIKELIQNKVYGDIKRFSYIVTDWYRPNDYYKKDKWRATYKSDGGGTFINQCPHNLDFLIDVIGFPKSIYSILHYGRYHEIEVEDEGSVYLEYDNFVNGIFVASTGETPGVNRFEIALDRAVISLSKENIIIKYNEYDEKHYRNLKMNDLNINTIAKTITFKDDNQSAYLTFLNNLIKMVRYKEKPIVSVKEALKSIYLTNAIYLSSFINQKIDLCSLEDKNINIFLKLFKEEFFKRVK